LSRHPTPDGLRLHAIAERIVDSLDRHARPRAVLLAGSAGKGIADQLSDVDLIAYYDRLPALPAIRAWRRRSSYLHLALASSAPAAGSISGPSRESSARAVGFWSPLRVLVRETGDIVEGRFPDLDTKDVLRKLAR
jgi:hypothetical protein